MINNHDMISFSFNKQQEIKELHRFFESGKLYFLKTTIPIYKNKNCFELKTWDWLSKEDCLDVKNIGNTLISHTSSNMKNPIIIKVPSNDICDKNVTEIKYPKKIMMFLDFVKNNDNVRDTNDRASIIYHPFPTAIRTLSHAVCLKFLYQTQVIYVPMYPGQQQSMFIRQ
jgi:hypothetical protein